MSHKCTLCGENEHIVEKIIKKKKTIDGKKVEIEEVVRQVALCPEEYKRAILYYIPPEIRKKTAPDETILEDYLDEDLFITGSLSTTYGHVYRCCANNIIKNKKSMKIKIASIGMLRDIFLSKSEIKSISEFDDADLIIFNISDDCVSHKTDPSVAFQFISDKINKQKRIWIVGNKQLNSRLVPSETVEYIQENFTIVELEEHSPVYTQNNMDDY